MSAVKPNIEPGWLNVLQEEFQKPYFLELKSFILAQQAEGKQVYPPGPLVFNAFFQTPFDQVKVVILGQDPYHGPGQAHGLSFSVPAPLSPPPSLKNIFHELKMDLGIETPSSGDLTPWAKQGVLLLNAVLTVTAGSPGSHRPAGWEVFTDEIIRILSREKRHLVFMLWGNFARQKAQLIDAQHHLILQAPHPSPFSAHTGFFGCHHFSACNRYLVQHGIPAVNWAL